MTPEMLAKSRETARLLGLGHVEFARVSPRSSRSRMAGPTS